MFEYIRGELLAFKDEYIVLENNNIGYRIFTSFSNMEDLKLGDQITMYIYYNLREDGVYLYGFYHEDELDIFNLLITVSSIGPKTALGILSRLSPGDLKQAIVNKDLETLKKAPGIGKKTAERIVLELKDKVEKLDIDMLGQEEKPRNNSLDLALEALESLGYSSQELKNVVGLLDLEDLNEEEIIKLILKNISN